MAEEAGPGAVATGAAHNAYADFLRAFSIVVVVLWHRAFTIRPVYIAVSLLCTLPVIWLFGRFGHRRPAVPAPA